MKPIIFTDLDGSLLNHHDYDATPAIPLLEALKANSIEVIATTSKTHLEVKALQQQLPLSPIHITENGGGIFIPRHFPKEAGFINFDDDFYLKPLGPLHADILPIIKQFIHAEELHLMSDMSINELMTATGLSYAKAILAQSRQFAEPFQWHEGSNCYQVFSRYLEGHKLSLIQGTRFSHISGQFNKATAMTWLCGYIRKHFDTPTLSIGIGDGQNDIALLEAADVSLVIPSEVHSTLTLNKSKHTYRANAKGSQGWQEGVEKLIHQFSLLKE